MNDLVGMVLAAAAGLALSLPMFGGLWLTLRRLPAARRPWLVLLLSFWGRLLLTAAGFVLVTAGDWRRGVAALVGFVIGRSILLHRLKTPRPEARGG